MPGWISISVLCFPVALKFIVIANHLTSLGFGIQSYSFPSFLLPFTRKLSFNISGVWHLVLQFSQFPITIYKKVKYAFYKPHLGLISLFVSHIKV